jgi:hypothetical protein
MHYRKKPVVIEAMQLTSNNMKDVLAWITNESAYIDDNHLYIKTLEGTMKANMSDYIIKGINGEIYPCKPDIFLKTYDSIDME